MKRQEYIDTLANRLARIEEMQRLLSDEHAAIWTEAQINGVDDELFKQTRLGGNKNGLSEDEIDRFQLFIKAC